jgi:ribosomal protein S13
VHKFILEYCFAGDHKKGIGGNRLSEEYLNNLRLKLWEKKRVEELQKYNIEKVQSAIAFSQKRTERQIWKKLCAPIKNTEKLRKVQLQMCIWPCVAP